jgi:hypothetical protein
MSKYAPLATYLQGTPDTLDAVTLSFAQIAHMLGTPLPTSAFKHRAWWSNQTKTAQRPQAQAWIGAGFRVDGLDQEPTSGWVRFKRL